MARGPARVTHGGRRDPVHGSSRIFASRAAWRVLALSVLLLLAGRSPTWAIKLTRCVSDDNHAYLIVATTQARSQVTSIAFTTGSANACTESFVSDPVVTSIALGQGDPLPNRTRTAVIGGLTTNSISCEGNFDPNGANGAGVLNLGDGRRVSADAGVTTEALVPLTTSDARVPAAMDVTSQSRSIPGCSVSGSTMVFPSTPGVCVPSDAATGEKANQTVTFDDTFHSEIGNAPPGNSVPPTQAAPDGFLLQGDCTLPSTCEILVFVATQDGTGGFAAAAAGFGLDSLMKVMNTQGQALNRDFNLPTATRTPTATPSPTASPTATPTPICGDGIRQGQEQCDDGNNTPGDCCAPNCLFEPPGSSCPDDGNVCTGDECDAQGHCLHDTMLDGDLCDDGNLCSGADLCAAGDCVGASDVSCEDFNECTADSCDPHAGCVNKVVVESPDCGTCSDCIDNDGDGLIDNEDPDCSDFTLFQRYAVIGTVPTGKLVSVRLGKNTQIIGQPTSCPPPHDARGAGACGMEVFVSTGVDVTGTLAAIGRTKFSGGLPHSWILDQYVNQGGMAAIKMGKFKPFVGPAILCSNGATPCNTNNDCVTPDLCDIGRELTDPADPHIDVTGKAPALKECINLQAVLPTVESIVMGFAIDEERGNVRLKRDSPPLTIDISSKGPGRYVIAFDELRTSRSRQIILKGNADQVLVIRVRGKFRLGTRGEIRVDGGLTQNHVLWLFEGAQGLVKVGAYADMDGTLIALGRRRISLGTFTTLDGAAYGQRVRMGRAAIVRHFPFGAKFNQP